jgi:hypothetical protein
MHCRNTHMYLAVLLAVDGAGISMSVSAGWCTSLHCMPSYDDAEINGICRSGSWWSCLCDTHSCSRPLVLSRPRAFCYTVSMIGSIARHFHVLGTAVCICDFSTPCCKTAICNVHLLTCVQGRLAPARRLLPAPSPMRLVGSNHINVSQVHSAVMQPRHWASSCLSRCASTLLG